MIPAGVLVDVLSVAIGGVAGTLVKQRLSGTFKDQLNLVLGLCSMAIGLQPILLMANMPAVVFSVILGTAAGLALHLDRHISAGAKLMQRGMSRLLPRAAGQQENTALLVTATVLFCASGTGIYGSVIAGMTGDHSILIAKAILDMFTAMVFACTLGPSVSIIAVPQLAVFSLLFLCARLIYPLTTPDMIDDFRACGGIIMLATGFRITGIRSFPIADMLPAMVLVMPISQLWSSALTPLLG